MYMFLQKGKEKSFKTRENLGDYDYQYLIKRYRLDRHMWIGQKWFWKTNEQI